MNFGKRHCRLEKKLAMVFGSDSHQKVESVSPLLDCGCGHVPCFVQCDRSRGLEGVPCGCPGLRRGPPGCGALEAETAHRSHHGEENQVSWPMATQLPPMQVGPSQTIQPPAQLLEPKQDSWNNWPKLLTCEIRG